MIKLQKLFFNIGLCLVVNMSTAQTVNKPLWQNKAFAVYKDSVVQQNKFIGKALSATELTSNYKSPANEFLSPAISFKFSINGKDNEMKSGIDHHFTCLATNGSSETPLIKFGQQLTDNRAVPDNTYLKPQTNFRIKLDMRDVLAAFEKDGYYTTFKGDKIYKQDFKGVYVAGNTPPLIWDFDNLVNHSELKLQDNDNDGIYETSLTLNDQKNEKATPASWKLSKDISAFPQYKSGYPLSDALYNLAIEEMINAVEPDSTFRTGKEWAGVWTRDISYSIILSMAYLQPKVARNSLLRKVNKSGRIIQDTGTGGAWPASTDRIIWAVAAWEVYKATGDKVWLKQAYQIIKNSLEDDYKVDYDKVTGLVKGESSFLDWREQTYPKWMQPVDIYESECLGTNAVHYQANVVLSNMAKMLKDETAAAKYRRVAERIKAGINKYLWMPEKGYYGQYLYGRNAKVLSPRSEALGEALCVLFGVADAEKQKQVIAKTPVMDFGIPCIYPQIPNIPPYHNNAVWPFVQTYYGLAAAKVANEEAVMESIAAIYRPAALWVTNKENFVASNGDYAGTQINSSNMLWSLSGSIALVHKIIFGININADGLSFRPFVPYALRGNRSLTNFTYRNAVLDIEMEGYGNGIKSFAIDGKASAPSIASSLNGHHAIKIVLAGKRPQPTRINTVEHYISLDAPAVTYDNKSLSWNRVEGAVQYSILKNGKEITRTIKTTFPVANENYGEYQVIAIDTKGVVSFASEPLIVAAPNLVSNYEIEKYATRSNEQYKGFSGEGFVEISKTKNTALT
ncbi:MAG: Bacterial alpha-L-rhamnosidase, partial [Segetibacter sp.]|nr:Bacterial alpha-L-rhamnosidase [Segetibacter sp.]